MPAAPLWPQPIPVLGLTGEHESGKTCFYLSACPDPARVRVYDLEGSATTYAALGFDHVNVAARLLEKFPKGYRPTDLWKWWLDDVKTLDAGRYDVIAVDPVTDLDAGLVDWVQANPGFFGHTSAQYEKMSGIMWGDVKAYLKLVLTGFVGPKCQTFAFVSHLGDEFDKETKKATGKRKPKGKDTLREIATLYLWLARKRDGDANRTGVPSAVVLKSRLSHMRLGPDGPVFVPALPPRLPEATPAAVRKYLLNPPDYAALRPEEQVPPDVLTEDDKLRLQAQKAEAERDVELMKLARIEREAEARERDALAAELDAALAAAADPAALEAARVRVKAALDQKQVDPTAADRLRERYLARKRDIESAPATVPPTA